MRVNWYVDLQEICPIEWANNAQESLGYVIATEKADQQQEAILG